MTRIGLTPNEAKTNIKEARRKRFDFLGYTFGPHRLRKTALVLGSQSVEEERLTYQAESGRSVGGPIKARIKKLLTIGRSGCMISRGIANFELKSANGMHK
jgi:hypothetical protein